jgi:N-acetylneuraminic acid mutarotase
MVAMMGTAFEEQTLQASFTFRIVEAIKRIKIHPMPRTTALPWGLSLAVGVIIAVFGFNPHLSVPSGIAFPVGSSLIMETKVLKSGEFPVDVLDFSQIPLLISMQGEGDGDKPDLQKAEAMIAQGKGGTWARKTDMPTARWKLSTSAVNGKIYAIGGIVGIDVHTATVEEYDPVADRWIRKSDMPTRRNCLSTAVVDGKIYAIGGIDSDTCALPTVEEYDPVKDEWTKKADMPTARWGLSVSAVKGKIYAIGGEEGCGRVIFQTVEEYDPVSDKWTKKADMPTRRVNLYTSVVNGKIYAIGGGNVQHDLVDYDGLSVVEEYDPATDTWTKKSNMPTARWSLCTSAVNNRIYAIGGADRRVPSGVVEEYNPATDTWVKKKENTPTLRAGTSASVVDGKIYVIGGGNIGWQILSTVEEYDPGFTFTEKKTVKPKGKLVTPWGEIKSD